MLLCTAEHGAGTPPGNPNFQFRFSSFCGVTSVRHRADFFFDFRGIHHDDRVPRAAIEEAAIRAFAEALLAPDAQNRVDLDAPERRIVLVGHPEHAIFHRAVLHAGRRSGAASAALRDYSQFFWLLLARGGDSLRARLKLLLVGHHPRGFDSVGCVCHFEGFYPECDALVSEVFLWKYASKDPPLQPASRLLQCPCHPIQLRPHIMFAKSFYKHLAPALLAGLALRLFFIWRFPFYSGDTAYYEELARNWLYHGVYGFYSHGQLLPSDTRGPGYPAFLAAIYFLAGTGRMAVMLAQACVDLVTCVFAAGVAARLAGGASEIDRGQVAAAALWLTALCPFTANYTAVPQTEVLAVFFTTLTLLIFLEPAGMEVERVKSNRDLLSAVKLWFAGGLVVGLGTLVRPETPLLLVAVLIALWIRYRRPANWKKLTLATLWMIAGLLLPLAPWAARNAVSVGRVQFLAPRYAETYGDVLPTGFYAWTKTWMFRFRDAYLFTWKLPSQPIDLKDVPSYAVDSPAEFSRVASLLDQYNRTRGMTRSLDLQFAELARERTRHHPIRTYVWIPIERTASMWFTPRTTLLPFSGRFWPLAESYHYNAAEFEVTFGFALLNVFYVGLFLAAAWFCHANPGVLLIITFIALRTAFLTQLQTCEPRYVLECFPALLAISAQLFRVPSKAFRQRIVIP